MGSGTLLIEYSSHCLTEKEYVLEWVLKDVFGLEWERRVDPKLDSEIRMSNSGVTLTIPDLFFCRAEHSWLTEATLPTLPLQSLDVESCFPERNFLTCETSAIYGQNTESTKVFEKKGRNGKINFDLFGSLFYLLSRYEEAVVFETDEHGRFPSRASLMGKAKLLDRAIGNEYIEILWAAMMALWPRIKRKKRSFRLLPSHDIDIPSRYAHRSLHRNVRELTADLLKRGSPKLFFFSLKTHMQLLKGNYPADPFDQVDWIMDQSEEANTKSSFYYIPEKTSRLDPCLPLDSPAVTSQWRRIKQREHEIGVHPGYESYRSEAAILSAAKAIKVQMDSMGIKQREVGGRHHYLRWQTPETARYWNQAGLDYDSTLGFADRAGFRCGVCYEYPMYDVVERKPLKLRQRPLVVMDCSVTASRYMNLGLTQEAHDYIHSLKQECKKYNGDFTILWHNTEVVTDEQKSFYRSILQS